MFENLKKLIAKQPETTEDSAVITQPHEYLSVDELTDYTDALFKIAFQALDRGHRYSQKTLKLTTPHRENTGYNEKIIQYVDNEPAWEVSTSRKMPVKVLATKTLTKPEYAALANTVARFQINHQR